MASLIRIGNSQGVRIPKPVIEQVGLEGRELELRIVDDGVLVRPVRPVREGWREAFEAMHESREEPELLEDLGPNEFDDLEWEWP